ncbi:MAG: ABC transporter permease [Planctomycetes bacterium]|nr:ABC transporter permease [Planctomycetota bacterium]
MMHKLRAFLTVLGIIFGIASVISMVAVSEGAKQEVIKQIEQLGVNNIFIRSKKPAVEVKQDSTSFIAKYGLRNEDVKHFSELFGSRLQTIALRNVKYPVHTLGNRVKVEAYAVNPPYFKLTNLELEGGRFFTDEDDNELSGYCVIGYDVAKKVFPVRDPLKCFVKIQDHAFKVIGVLKNKESMKTSTIQTFDVNETVFIPYKSWYNRMTPLTAFHDKGAGTYEYVEITELILSFDSSINILDVKDVISNYLEKSFPNKDYDMTIPYELLQQKKQAQKIFALVMISIASLALIVGGIGIMNIMLASVLERIKEIGTRRALGATKRLIRMQFLSESVCLSMIGGIIGIGIGVGLSFIISTIVQWQVIFTPLPIFAAFFISVIVGIVFGTYPAIKASNLDPIEALRSE